MPPVDKARLDEIRREIADIHAQLEQFRRMPLREKFKLETNEERLRDLQAELLAMMNPKGS